MLTLVSKLAVAGAQIGERALTADAVAEPGVVDGWWGHRAW